jgi:hypothetical protein
MQAQFMALMSVADGVARGLPTALINDPRGLREANEKLYALNFPDVVPPSLVTCDLARLETFMDELGGEMIVKPLDGAGGRLAVDGRAAEQVRGRRRDRACGHHALDETAPRSRLRDFFRHLLVFHCWITSSGRRSDRKERDFIDTRYPVPPPGSNDFRGRICREMRDGDRHLAGQMCTNVTGTAASGPPLLR